MDRTQTDHCWQMDRKVGPPIAHQHQLGLHYKGEPGTGEERVLSFWATQDFIKPLFSKPGGIAYLPNTKEETQKPSGEIEAKKKEREK